MEFQHEPRQDSLFINDLFVTKHAPSTASRILAGILGYRVNRYCRYILDIAQPHVLDFNKLAEFVQLRSNDSYFPLFSLEQRQLFTSRYIGWFFLTLQDKALPNNTKWTQWFHYAFYAIYSTGSFAGLSLDGYGFPGSLVDFHSQPAYVIQDLFRRILGFYYHLLMGLDTCNCRHGTALTMEDAKSRRKHYGESQDIPEHQIPAVLDLPWAPPNLPRYDVQ